MNQLSKLTMTTMALTNNRVTGRNERILPIAGDATNTPYSTAPRTAMSHAGPRRDAGWVVYRHAYQPTIKHTAIRHAPISNINGPAFTMPSAGRCCWMAALKVLPLYVAVAATSTGRPWVMCASVYVNGNDEMLYGHPAIGCGYRVQKQRA